MSIYSYKIIPVIINVVYSDTANVRQLELVMITM